VPTKEFVLILAVHELVLIVALLELLEKDANYRYRKYHKREVIKL